MATTIKKKPDKKVAGLGAPTRGSSDHRMTASWKVPSSMVKESSDSRATELNVAWKVGMSTGARTLSNDYSTSRTSVTLNLNNFTIGNTNYTRNSFYPNKERRLTYVSIAVSGKNSKGTGGAAKQTRKFEKPRKPTISTPTFSTSGATAGRVSATITTDAGTDYRERYDTKYRITVKNTRTNNTTVIENTDTSTSFSRYYDATDYQALDPNKPKEYIQVKFEAYARGYAGNSEKAVKYYYVSYPAKPTINKVTVSSKDSTGKLTAKISTNASTAHPVDVVKLEYLKNVTYAKVSDFPADLPSGTEWEESGIEDNGKCTALSMPVSTLMPDRGKYTWIRVKSYHAHEAVLYRYSNYVRVKALETPAEEAAEDTITIISAASGADGKSAVVQLGWNKNGTDDSTGTELSWSEDEDTWKSTEEPKSFEFEWSDGRYPATGTKQYNDSAEIVIKELSEGTKYFIRARRYYEGDSTTYGRYSNTATVLTSTAPAGVVARCNSFVPEGESLPVYWTFGGDGLQTEWQIIDSNGTTVASGTGSVGGTQLSAERLAELAVDNVITFTVQVSTGSGFISSEEHTVTIQEKPELSITVSDTITEQPISFTAECDSLCDLIVIVTAQGCSGQFPQGYRMQVEGDTIHSDVYSPEWDEGVATITLPISDFWDLGSYTLSVVAEDRETGLRCEAVTAEFKINWANQAVDPDDAVSLIPLDYRTDSGEHIQAVQINLTPPTNCNNTDVYDIYRMDGENAHLIGEGFPLTYTATDYYAPFGDDVYYRVALRTEDGDVEFADKPYELVSDTIRIDWADGSLELPYGVTIADSYSKDVEFRSHMDGSIDGYWNQNIERKGSYSSAVIKLIQPDEINLARQLARYAGAVFVRTANGSAYTADVQVTDLSVKNKAVTAIAIDATEVGLTEEFELPSPFEQEEE